MNRSILIVIADFLLISLLAFSSFDANRLTEPPSEQPAQPKLAIDAASTNQDLLGILRVALQEERRAREQLAQSLTQTKESSREQQSLLAERNQQIQTLHENLQRQEQQARQFATERGALLQQSAVAQTNMQRLQQQLQSSAAEAALSKEKLAVMEGQLRWEQDQATALQQQLALLETNQLALEAEKHQLTGKLQAVEAEKRLATNQLALLRDEVQTVRTEKARLLEHADRLAEGVTNLAQSSEQLAKSVSNLAQNSGALTQEVREYRPLAANTIFTEFATNRVHTQIDAGRRGLLGMDLGRQKAAETILVTDGTNTFALCHIEDTPFTLWDPGTDWESLNGVLSRGNTRVPIQRVSFFLLDPRVVLIPVTDPQARQLGCRIYRLAAHPFKFQDAVLVGTRDGYYGESKFQIDLSTPQYVKMDRSLFRGLFGKFNPSRGDLVFSKSGELLGIMANSSYCIVIHNFTTAAAFQFGPDVRSQHTGEVLAALFKVVYQLPMKLH
jgi:hypothetical protein